jgi:hypothetical protein
VLQKIEQIKRSRSGSPNFESHEAESWGLQLVIGQYIHLRALQGYLAKFEDENSNYIFTWFTKKLFRMC